MSSERALLVKLVFLESGESRVEKLLMCWFVRASKGGLAFPNDIQGLVSAEYPLFGLPSLSLPHPRTDGVILVKAYYFREGLL